MADASPVVFLVLVAISSLIVGIILASLFFILSGAGGGGEKTRRRLPAPLKDAVPPPEEPELLRVSRTKKGNLMVYVQGRPYRHLQEIPDPQVGIETTEAIKAVLAFAKGLLPAAPPTASQPAPQKSPADEAAFLEQLRQAERFSTGKPVRVAPLRTPAEEINDLIQQRLERWPDLLKEKVRLTTHEDGSLRIHVGLYTYKTVDDVPDPKARALIKDAIREWENSRRYG